MTDEQDPFAQFSIDIINEQLNGQIDLERGLSPTNEMSVRIDILPERLSEEIHYIRLPSNIEEQPPITPILIQRNNPVQTIIPPPPPAPPVVLSSYDQNGSYAEMASFSTSGLIRQVLAERIGRARTTDDVEPDENYVNFNDLEDVKITLKQSSLTELRTIIDFTKISTCMICWDSIMDEAIELPCQHYFHEECIKTWLSEFSYVCPMCKEAAGEREAHL